MSKREVDIIKGADGLYLVGSKFSNADGSTFHARSANLLSIKDALTNAKELAKHTGFQFGIVSNLVLREIVESEGFTVIQDGNQWMASGAGFINLQESTVWFNSSYNGAVNDLLNGDL